MLMEKAWHLLIDKAIRRPLTNPWRSKRALRDCCPPGLGSYLGQDRRLHHSRSHKDLHQRCLSSSYLHYRDLQTLQQHRLQRCVEATGETRLFKYTMETFWTGQVESNRRPREVSKKSGHPMRKLWWATKQLTNYIRQGH